MRRTLFVLAVVGIVWSALAATTPNKTVKYYFNAQRPASKNGYIWCNGDSGDVVTFYPAQQDTTGKGRAAVWVGGSRILWYVTVDSTDVYQAYETTGLDSAITGMDRILIWTPAAPESLIVSQRSLATGVVGSDAIEVGSVTGSKIPAGALTPDKLLFGKGSESMTPGDFLSFTADGDSFAYETPSGSGTVTAVHGSHGGYLTVTDSTADAHLSINTTQLDTRYVNEAQANSVDSTMVSAIGSGDITDGQVKAADIQNLTITSGKLAADAVGDTTKVATSSIASSDIVDGQVKSADIQDLGVALADLAATAVDSSKVPAGSLGLPDLNFGTAAAGKYLRASGTGHATWVGFGGDATFAPGTGRHRQAFYVSGMTTAYRCTFWKILTADEYEPTSGGAAMAGATCQCKADSVVFFTTTTYNTWTVHWRAWLP